MYTPRPGQRAPTSWASWLAGLGFKFCIQYITSHELVTLRRPFSDSELHESIGIPEHSVVPLILKLMGWRSTGHNHNQDVDMGMDQRKGVDH